MVLGVRQPNQIWALRYQMLQSQQHPTSLLHPPLPPSTIRTGPIADQGQLRTQRHEFVPTNLWYFPLYKILCIKSCFFCLLNTMYKHEVLTQGFQSEELQTLPTLNSLKTKPSILLFRKKEEPKNSSWSTPLQVPNISPSSSQKFSENQFQIIL